MNIVTIVFLVSPLTVWLAPKKRKLGVGLLNGYGGKVEDGETIIQCAIRETGKESTTIITPADMVHITVIDFFNEDLHTFRGHIFLATRWVGIPCESEEMGPPEEFRRNNLPLNKMLPGDAFWVPEVMKGIPIPPRWHDSPQQINDRSPGILHTSFNLINDSTRSCRLPCRQDFFI